MVICLGPTPTVQRVMVFDHLAMGQVNRAVRVYESASGKSVNTARVLKTLGCRPLTLGFVGGDRGQFVRHDLDNLAIQQDWITISGQTRICTTIINHHTTEHTELVEESQAVPPACYDQLLEKLSGYLPQARLLVLSGSLTPQAPADFYGQCLKLAGQREVPVILDASGTPLLEGLKHKPLLIKPNLAEVSATLKRSVTPAQLPQAMRQLTQMGPRWVLVTLGPPGALLSDGQSIWKLENPQVQVCNSIGSGDSVAAGLAAGILEGLDIPQACRLALACGAANATTPLPGQVDADLVGQLRKQVTLNLVRE